MRDPGALLHAVAGATVAALVMFGFGREYWQHRDDTPVWTRHRVIEAAAWPAGGIVAGVVGVAIIRRRRRS